MAFNKVTTLLTLFKPLLTLWLNNNAGTSTTVGFLQQRYQRSEQSKQRSLLKKTLLSLFMPLLPLWLNTVASTSTTVGFLRQRNQTLSILKKDSNIILPSVFPKTESDARSG